MAQVIRNKLKTTNMFIYYYYFFFKLPRGRHIVTTVANDAISTVYQFVQFVTLSHTSKATIAASSFRVSEMNGHNPKNSQRSVKKGPLLCRTDFTATFFRISGAAPADYFRVIRHIG